MLIGVWFINPALDPGKEGPPFPLSVADLTALFADAYDVVDDYVPDVWPFPVARAGNVCACSDAWGEDSARTAVMNLPDVHFKS